MTFNTDEYEWDTPMKNPFSPMTYPDSIKTASTMSDRQIERMGLGGEEELQDLINQCYMLYE
jgi:hypothetical protein